MKWRPSFLATAPVVPVPKNGSSTTSPGLEDDRSMRASSASGFWVGWTLRPSAAFQALVAGAERNEPVRAHLHVFVAGFQRVVMERVAFRLGAFRGPDHGLVRVGEATAAEVRHRVGLAPHDVVEEPEVEILQGRADPEDVVVGADHPQRRVLFHDAAHAREPGAGEAVVIGEARELVPVVVDGVDEALVRARQRLFELQIVGRIGEDHVHALGRELRQRRDAIAEKDLVERRGPAEPELF